MGWTLGIGMYFVIWWTLFTAALPFWVKTQQEAGEIVPGSERSAPVKPEMLKKVLLNTVVSALVWALIDVAYIYFYVRR